MSCVKLTDEYEGISAGLPVATGVIIAMKEDVLIDLMESDHAIQRRVSAVGAIANDTAHRPGRRVCV